MKRSLVINILLALVVAGLGAWMVLQPGEKIEPQSALSALKRDDISSVRIVRKDLPEFVLERQGKQWKQTAPFPARVDNSQIGRLVDLTAATSKQKLPATDLARFELDQPFARVTLNKQEFAFGTVNSLTNEQYVLTDGAVYLITPTFGFGLPTRPDSLASHMLLAEDEVPAGITVGNMSALPKDGKLVLSPAPAEAERPSQDELQQWIEEWRYASSLATQPVGEVPKGDVAKLVLKDGRTVEFVIAQRVPQLVLVRPDEKLQFVFAAEQAGRLFAPSRKK